VWEGRVFIVAGRGETFTGVARRLVADGALVAVITTDEEVPDVAARFRADHTDPDVWDRVVPHVEQRLGPIDAVLTDQLGYPTAERLVGPDLLRRGHGAVVVVPPEADADSVLRTLIGTP
jgi:NAD(P)-dependent dehydrogenase (short-subunit alcohol dehydrogenase family)